jgi:hypothetical protein
MPALIDQIRLEGGERRRIPFDREQALPAGQVQARAQAATACEKVDGLEW